MKTVLNVKTDKDVKEKAQALAKHMGIPLSTIVNAHLKAFIASGEFTVTREPQLRPEVTEHFEGTQPGAGRERHWDAGL